MGTLADDLNARHQPKRSDDTLDEEKKNQPTPELEKSDPQPTGEENKTAGDPTNLEKGAITLQPEAVTTLRDAVKALAGIFLPEETPAQPATKEPVVDPALEKGQAELVNLNGNLETVRADITKSQKDLEEVTNLIKARQDEITTLDSNLAELKKSYEAEKTKYDELMEKARPNPHQTGSGGDETAIDVAALAAKPIERLTTREIIALRAHKATMRSV